MFFLDRKIRFVLIILKTNVPHATDGSCQYVDAFIVKKYKWTLAPAISDQDRTVRHANDDPAWSIFSIRKSFLSFIIMITETGGMNSIVGFTVWVIERIIGLIHIRQFHCTVMSERKEQQNYFAHVCSKYSDIERVGVRTCGVL